MMVTKNTKMRMDAGRCVMGDDDDAGWMDGWMGGCWMMNDGGWLMMMMMMMMRIDDDG